LFAAEGEDPEDKGSDEGDYDDGEQPNADRQGLMGNTHARRSWVDLSDPGETVVQNGGPKPGAGNLGAKAGIILVRFDVVSLKANSLTSFFFPDVLGYT
jgi:hypothetical protein